MMPDVNVMTFRKKLTFEKLTFGENMSFLRFLVQNRQFLGKMGPAFSRIIRKPWCFTLGTWVARKTLSLPGLFKWKC